MTTMTNNSPRGMSLLREKIAAKSGRDRDTYAIAAECILEWLGRDCDVDDDEFGRETIEMRDRGWLHPEVEA